MSQYDPSKFSSFHKDNRHVINSNQLKAEKNENTFIRENYENFRLQRLSYKSIWSKEDDEKLLNLVSLYGAKKWDKISEYFLSKSAIQCSARHRKIDKNIKKGKWTEEEKRNLCNLIQIYGNNWGIIAKYMKTRTSSQIRDKYLNTLDPNLQKKKFSLEEDLKIVKYFKIYGPDWNQIKLFLEDRTPNIIKSRFYSKLRIKYRLGNYSISFFLFFQRIFFSLIF